MKKINWFVCIGLTFTISLSVFTGCNNGGSTNKGVKPNFDMVEPLTLTWMIPTQQGLTLAETPLFKDIQKKLNVTLKLTELPVGQFNEKKRLLIASKQIPDIMSWVTSSESNQYGPAGAFLDITNYLKDLPNFKSKIDSTIKANPESKYAVYNSADKIYMTPHYMVSPIPIWDMSYVKSTFDEVGATKLDTWDEVYAALKLIKAKNPSYYPMAFRNLGGLQTPLRLFVESFTGGKASTLDYIGFDYDKNTFEFGPDVAGYKEAVAYFAQYFMEGLIDPDYTVLDEQMLKTRIIKGKVVMIAEFLGGWTGFPGIMKDLDNKLIPLATPKANNQPQIISRQMTNFDPSVGTIINASIANDASKLGRCLKMLDYIYSDEFYNVQWNNPDVATKQVDGSYKYKDKVYDSEGYQVLNDTYFPWSMMAIFQDSTDCRPSPGGAYQLYRDNYLRNTANKDKYKPFPIVPFTVAQQAQVNNYIAAITDRYNSGIAVFAEGKRPISEWGDFTTELKNAGGTELIKIYNDAYKSMKK